MGLTKNLGWLSKYITADSSGKVGIGASSPLNKLDVAGNISLSNGGSNVIRILQSVQAAAYNGPGFYSQSSIGYGVATGGSHIFIGSTDGNTEVMRINSIGNVGIGTNAPTTFTSYTTLAVNGPSGCALELKAGDVSGLRIFSDTGSSYLYENRNTSIKFYTNGSLNATMFPNGNMVISNIIADAGYKLDVNGTGRFVGSVRIGNVDFGTSQVLSLAPGVFGIDAPGVGNGRFVVDGSGNVGIGIPNPAYKLDIDGYLAVKSGSYGGGGIVIKNYAASGASRNWGIFNDQLLYGDLCINTSSTQTGHPGTTRIYITPDGTTLFRRTTNLDPSYAAGFEGAVFFKCAVNGNNSVNFFNASTTYVASIVTNASSIVYGTGSDYRLKEDLKDFNGLEKISKIKVYDFKFIKEGDRMDGVLAHELQEVVPYAVTGEKDEVDNKGNIKIQNVDYSKLTPILIKAIQELTERIKILENK